MTTASNENSIGNSPKLPFIFITEYRMKILIDTDASSSVSSLDIGFHLFPEYDFDLNSEFSRLLIVNWANTIEGQKMATPGPE